MFGKYRGTIEVSYPVVQLGFFHPGNFSEVINVLGKNLLLAKFFPQGTSDYSQIYATDLNIKTRESDIKQNIIIHDLYKWWKNC